MSVSLDFNFLGTFDYATLVSPLVSQKSGCRSVLERQSLYISTIVYCIFWVHGWNWNFFEWENHPPPLLNTEWLWKLAYAADLTIFLNGFSLKLQGIIILKCQIYAVVKVILMRRNVVWITKNIKLFYILHMSKVKTSGIYISIPICSRYSSKIKVQFQQWFLELSASKGLFKFQNPFNCPVKELSSNLPLEQRNDKLVLLLSTRRRI